MVSPRVRKHLCADALLGELRNTFADVPDPRSNRPAISLADTLMAAFAVFSLKDPSLLAFEARRHERNLKALYGIDRVPCDTQMRSILDPVDPEYLRPAFRAMLRQLQRGKVLEDFVWHDGHYLLLIDGVEYFRSQKIHCSHCQICRHRDGSVDYYHQMLVAVLAHPDRSEVFPLACEPICRPEGQTKNDSERAAAKRLVAQVRHDHPHLSLIVGMDGEFATGPMLKELAARDMGFILTAQDGDHTHLVQQVQAAQAAGKLTEVVRHDPVTGQEQRYRYVNDLELNETHPDLKVNYLEYRQDDGEQEHRWTWVTHLRLGKGTVTAVMRGGRARWKIENETFNTLKNQGYHYEHNYGHGKEHLSGVLATLMLLAFLVDQVQQASCPLFQAVWAKLKSKRALWEKIRSLFEAMLLSSWQQLYEALLYGFERHPPVILTDTS